MADDRDRDAITPILGPPHAIFRDEAARVADELDELALIRGKRLDRLDTSGAREAREIGRTLRAISRRFDAWPRLGRPAADREWAELTTRLVRAMRRAVALLAASPRSP